MVILHSFSKMDFSYMPALLDSLSVFMGKRNQYSVSLSLYFYTFHTRGKHFIMGRI